MNAYLDTHHAVWLYYGLVERLTAAGWTQDPFDRLIVAHAKANSEAMLITADTVIRKHYPRAIW